TALFTGSTGTGKTETTKAIAHALYPDEPVLLNINMPDYKNASDEGRFRKRLGEFVRHTPNAVVLLDELEKAADELKDALLVILDEGLVTFETVNREGAVESNTVSLRNTVIICTPTPVPRCLTTITVTHSAPLPVRVTVLPYRVPKLTR